MEKELTNQVLSQVDSIVSTIQQDPLYEKYLFLAHKVETHSEIMGLIQKVKELQKKAVHEEALHHEETTHTLDLEIETILAKLQEYPLYVEFLEMQEELDDVFQTVKIKIEEILP